MKHDDEWFSRETEDSLFSTPGVLVFIGVLLTLLGLSCARTKDAPVAPGALPPQAMEALHGIPKAAGHPEATAMYMVWCAHRDSTCAIQQFSEGAQSTLVVDRQIDRMSHKVELTRMVEHDGSSTVSYQFNRKPSNLRTEDLPENFHGKVAVPTDQPVELQYQDVRIFFVSSKAYEGLLASTETKAS